MPLSRRLQNKGVILLLLAFLAATLCPGPVYAAPSGQTPSGISYAEMASLIDSYAEEYVGKTSPGAAVVIVKDGEIIFSKGYGYADKEKGIAVDPSETVFEYASVSKLFVYTTIMRLVEEGRLELDRDIRTYLPQGFLKKLRYDDPITLLHVMNHTTGFEDCLFDLILTSPEGFPTLEQTLLTCQPAQVYRPGTVSAYSNYAVALAAYIVQGIIGQEFYEYLRDTIFKPLGMGNTSAHPLLADHASLVQRKAAGYYRLPDADSRLQPDADFKKGDWSYVPLYPAGSVNGTAEDLARFAIALTPPAGEKSPLFQKRQTLDQMLTQSHAMGPAMAGFAHGFMEREGQKAGLGHGGNSACFAAQINIVPEERFGVVVLCNASNEMHLTEGLMQMLLGAPEKARAAYEGELPETGEVEGLYIAARRPHNGFLKLYGYLSLLRVKTLEPDIIKISLGGQSGTYIQTRPYVFERLSASGSIFKYNFGTVYFEIADGKVKRISGDFLPLPGAHTLPWLIADGAAAATCIAFFLLMPLYLLMGWLVRHKHKKPLSAAPPPGSSFSGPPLSGPPFLVVILTLCGTGLAANNGLLALRMLANNYRSFAEVRFHILLNYPLAALAAVFCLLLILNWKRIGAPFKWKAALALSALLLALLTALLIKWQFFHILA